MKEFAPSIASKTKLTVARHHLETRSRSNFKFSFEISIYLYCCFVLMIMTGDVGRGGGIRFDHKYKNDYEIELLLIFSLLNLYLQYLLFGRCILS